MKEPSTEKEPGEESRALREEDTDRSHEAVGIGVIGRPQTEPESVESPEPAKFAEEESAP